MLFLIATILSLFIYTKMQASNSLPVPFTFVLSALRLVLRRPTSLLGFDAKGWQVSLLFTHSFIPMRFCVLSFIFPSKILKWCKTFGETWNVTAAKQALGREDGWLHPLTLESSKTRERHFVAQKETDFYNITELLQRTRTEKTKHLSNMAGYALKAKLGIRELEMN
jgi:hypothetical protein